MNKSELIMKVAEDADISKANAEAAVNALIASITTELKEGGSVSLTGFGTFWVRARAARRGRNPQTGEPIEVAAANIPGFKAGKSLKDAVN
ncbi:HU family DNA-binding protein [Aeromonas veronii]|uniref:HU family DNA-binding protein n=1 Tax=Aeromonas TaxID=642 RepID=UPI000640A07A|nr:MULTISPECIES: HU family DNA-binding protein [Aeromonas]AKJ36885.1 transcriptional regulator HU subunit alpha [Aeromonas hydrophila NJ-35]ALZ82592.1 DNA-binding protein HU [Aeromonas hydrophila]MBW3762769.1 HU family DNA-binding protein [Aeromonas jandaei]MBW3779164.1 HU family DNA-binding protein [Aeromonas veronii]QGW99133.1 HU family DNA-binding protein [Aeromonas veronii]